MEFLNWHFLTEYAGALMAVMLITQLIKNIWVLKKLPVQMVSYITALAVLYPANFFTGQLTWSSAVLILLNGLIVALAANGGYEAINNMKKK